MIKFDHKSKQEIFIDFETFLTPNHKTQKIENFLFVSRLKNVHVGQGEMKKKNHTGRIKIVILKLIFFLMSKMNKIKPFIIKFNYTAVIFL